MAQTKSSLIRLEPVVQIVRTAIWTGALADEKPVSLVLIASQESAKSAALLIFEGSKTVVTFSDLTSKGLDFLKPQITSREVRHIIALDLIRIVTHARSVSDRTIQTLAGLMEEGQASTADPGGIHTWEGYPTCGVLVGITPEFYRSKRGHWRGTGFLTRFLPVFFHYSEATKQVIHAKISRGLQKPLGQPQQLPKEPMSVKLTNGHAEQIKTWAVAWGLQNETYGFRHHYQLRALLKARAALHGRNQVTEDDMREVESWQRFFSTHQPAIL